MPGIWVLLWGWYNMAFTGLGLNLLVLGAAGFGVLVPVGRWWGDFRFGVLRVSCAFW